MKSYYEGGRTPAQLADLRRRAKEQWQARKADKKEFTRFKRKISKSVKALSKNPEYVALHSQRAIEMWEDALYYQKQVKAHKQFVKEHPEERARLATLVKGQWKDPNFVEKIHNSKLGILVSKPQRWLYKALKAKGYRPKLEYKAGRKSIDIAILPSLTLGHAELIAIEVDGAYWHKDKKAEAARNKYLEKRGWRVIHVSATTAAVKKFAFDLPSLKEAA
jgi:restriction endonuclease-like protein